MAQLQLGEGHHFRVVLSSMYDLIENLRYFSKSLGLADAFTKPRPKVLSHFSCGHLVSRTVDP